MIKVTAQPMFKAKTQFSVGIVYNVIFISTNCSTYLIMMKTESRYFSCENALP